MIEHYILDTNIILSEKKNLNKILESLKSKNYYVFTTEVSIHEIKGQVSRSIKQSILNIETIINSSVGQYFRNSSNYDANEAIRKSQVKIDKTMEDYFNMNIIPLNTDNHKIKTIFNRANDRNAPFSKKENSSDKGFKDTLLWLSIIDYYKNKSDINVNFVTSDNIFHDYISELKDEFNKETNLNIEIRNLASIYDSKIDNLKDKKLGNLPETSIDLKILDDTINNFLYSEVSDIYGNKDIKRNFIIHKFIENEDISNLLDYLDAMLKTKYSLFRAINLFIIFTYVGIESTIYYEIESQKCRQLIDFYQKTKIEDKIYLESFIELLKEKFNSLFDLDPNDLPF